MNVQNLTSKSQIRQEVISQQSQQEEGNEEILPNVQEEAESLETDEFEYAEIDFTPKERETAKKIEDEATNIMGKISIHVGDFTNRIWNTRTKIVRSQKNLQIIKKCIYIFRMTSNLMIGNESAPVLCQVFWSQELVQYCYSGVMS